jgi:hypothetical protein
MVSLATGHPLLARALVSEYFHVPLAFGLPHKRLFLLVQLGEQEVPILRAHARFD